MSILFREHRGGLSEAMETAVTVPDIPAMIAHLARIFADVGFGDLRREDVTIEPYGGDDDRIGWKNVHIVCTDRVCRAGQPPWGPLGFCAATDGRPLGTETPHG